MYKNIERNYSIRIGQSYTIVTEGEGKGMKLLDCNVTEYEKCIDEIREVIGDKILERSDLPSIKPILKKY